MENPDVKFFEIPPEAFLAGRPGAAVVKKSYNAEERKLLKLVSPVLALRLWPASKSSVDDPENDFRVRVSSGGAGFTTVSCPHGMCEVGALEQMDKFGRIYHSADPCDCEDEDDSSRLEGETESESGDEEVFTV